MNDYVISFIDGTAPMVVTAVSSDAAMNQVAESDRSWVASVIKMENN